MKKTTILSIFLFFMGGMLPMMADNITVGGTSRSYNVYVPKNLGENRPLLIFCHGATQSADWMQNNEFKNEKVSMEAVCDTAKFIVVFPNGIDTYWDTSGDRDINFIKAIINKMANDYKIDRNRVYLGGFSMGGMLTYHAMNRISDIIAAFVPVSGYPMGGATANANARPIPILHIHGTADERCAYSGAQPAVKVWANHNGCPTTAKTINNYNNFPNAKLYIWGPGNDNVEVRLLELPDKGHWICKEPQVYTGKEIWNFCKKYSLNKTSPNISITSPKNGGKLVSFAPEGESAFSDITLTATADDPNGTIEKVEFYDGTTLVATCTEAPYQAVLSGATAGKHILKAVATDNDGETSAESVEVTLQSPKTFTISSGFTEANALPEGWAIYDSEERRSGYSNGYSLGCRVLQFTGSPRGLDYGLYIRNKNGSAHQGWAKFGLAETGNSLSLAPGHYTLKYKICNWDMSNYGPVELSIENRANSKSIASKTYTPNVNIGNATYNSFGSVEQQTFEFDVTEQGDYVVAVYSAPSPWSDCIIGQLVLSADSYATGIEVVEESTADEKPQPEDGATYDIMGRKTSATGNGMFIQNGKKYVR